MVDDERILTSIAIMREKYNLGAYEVCACVGQPIHSSQYLGRYVYTLDIQSLQRMCKTDTSIYAYTHSSYMTLIGVHEIHGRLHPN